MKKLIRFIDEIADKIFNTEKEASASEKKHKEVQSLFEFYTKIKQYNNCDFINGGWCVQRNKEFYDKLIEGIYKGVKMLHPEFMGIYKRDGKQFDKSDCQGGKLLGRLLDDNDSYLYTWFGIQYKICPKCYREYGQPYYAINCKCDNSFPAREI